MKKLLATLLMLGWVQTWAQEAMPRFSSPIDYELKLAGNFGEPRPNHFHCGIDVKTQGVEGKPIYSIDEGYISRITVGHFGFGLALYVSHPCGFTSVYCHLRSFVPEIQEIVKKYQYERESFNVDIKLSADELPVQRGQLMAYSGNTGSSLAPHLHLELWRTADGALVDPLPCFMHLVPDNTAPKARGLMLYPKENEGVVSGSTQKQVFNLGESGVAQPISAWGKMSAAIWADDYMDGTSNHYGIWQISLKVDGRQVFYSQTDSFMPRENRFVNSWGDYDTYMRRKVWYLKAFVEPGNTLSMLHTDENRGWVDINEERDYHFEYTLTDFYGNARTYTFTVRGEAQDIPTQPHTPSKYDMRWNSANVLQEPGLELTLPRGTLADDITLNYFRTAAIDGASDYYTLHDSYAPLMASATLKLAPRYPVSEPRQLYIATLKEGKMSYVGGEYNEGWVSTTIRELGTTYTLATDSVTPMVTPVNPGTWTRSSTIRFNVKDEQSGISSCKGYVDGKFVLFTAPSNRGDIVCNLDDTPIDKTGQTHHLELRVTDRCHNMKIMTADIVY